MSKAVMQQALEALILAQQDAQIGEADYAIVALRAALAEPDEYAAQNPLGGPAKVFDAMANAIRAGDDYHATLRRYGFAEVKALAEPEQEPKSLNDGRLTQYPDGSIGLGTTTPRKPERTHAPGCHNWGLAHYLCLRQVNAELLEALKDAAECVQSNYLPDKMGHDWDDVIAKAEASK